MRAWNTLLGGFVAVQFAICGALFLEKAVDFATSAGKAYVSQTGVASASQEYDTSFGKTWESVRTFRLLHSLEKPLKVYVEPRGRQGAMYRSQYRDYVLKSLALWSEALEGRLQYMLVSDRRDADITVDWVPGFSDRYVAGVTTYRVGHARIEIKTIGVPEQDIQANVIHEFGHALGIAGHSRHAGDIMVGTRRWRRDGSAYNPTLSTRDVHAIRRLYSAYWQRGEDLYSDLAQSQPIMDGTVAYPVTAQSVPANVQSGVVGSRMSP